MEEGGDTFSIIFDIEQFTDMVKTLSDDGAYKLYMYVIHDVDIGRLDFTFKYDGI